MKLTKTQRRLRNKLLLPVIAFGMMTVMMAFAGAGAG